MNKVITINLNGRAYQLEEAGYEALQKYLREAEEKLSGDTGKQEIMADLEQAISEKCDQYLSMSKTVVTADEAEKIIQQMGPVQAAGDRAEEKTEHDASAHANTKRLYQIREGAMLSGVCAGLAAYFNVDVTLIRIAFVLLTILTHGLGILIYIVMMIVVPRAQTSEEKAAASGEPFTAQDFVNRARQEYVKFQNSGEWQKWKQQWKEHAEAHKRERKSQQYVHALVPHSSVFFGLLGSVLSIAWVVGLVIIVSTGTLFGLILPFSIPLWVTILAWVCVYSFIMWPLRAVTWTSYSQNGQDIQYYHQEGFVESMVWLAFSIILVWAVWHYIPGSQKYFRDVSVWAGHVWNSMTHKGN